MHFNVHQEGEAEMKNALALFMGTDATLLFIEELQELFAKKPFDPDYPYQAMFYDQRQNSLQAIPGVSEGELSEILLLGYFYELPNLWINLQAPFIVGNEMRPPITNKAVISFFQGFGHRNGLVIEPPGISLPEEFHKAISQKRDRSQGITSAQ